MAFPGSEYTLPEVLRQVNPDMSYAPYIDVLSKDLPLLGEAHWERANDFTSHEFVQVSSKPTGTLVRHDEGAPYEASGTVPVREQLARMESNFKIDIRSLKKSPNPVQFRRDREALHLLGMMESFEKIIFDPVAATGDATLDPKSINGLWKRYSALATGSVVGNGASGGNSIWLVGWGMNGAFFIYPREGKQTLVVDDLKEQVVSDANGNPYRAVVTNFAFEFGLGVADPRAVKRLCNIAATGNNSFFEDGTKASKGEEALLDLIEQFPNGGAGLRIAIYANRTMVASMRKRLMNRSNIYWGVDTIWGRQGQLHFNGFPVIRSDSLPTNESTVS